MENQLTVVLPVEVAQIAESVSVEKRNEVQSVLNHVFNGVAKMREQLDTVTVDSPDDKVNMKLANTIRLGVRQVRLDAEKTFDAKRDEVQQQMLSYKTEDSLWLKAKQTMQILTKEIEENARWKEETKERFEAEQRELKIQQRMIQVAKVAPEMPRSEFEYMSDASFEIFLSGIEKQYNDRIEAEQKAEAERIAKEKAEEKKKERLNKMFTLGLKFDGEQFLFRDINFHWTDLICLSDVDFEKAFEGAKKRKEQIESEEKAENERLRVEAEAKEKQLQAERAKAESERKAFEEDFRKVREEADRKLKAEQETARIASQKAEAERAKLQAELKAKQDAELKAKQAAELADKKAKAAPDKAKLLELAKTIDALNLPELKGVEAQKILSDVKTLLSKVSAFITEKTELI